MGSLVGNMRNVKVFVLYLMENINYPLDFITLNDIVMQNDYVMYLDFAEGFNQMLDTGLIEKIEYGDQECYIPTEKGRHVARELKGDILSSILDQSLTCALRYLDFKKRGIECKCTVQEIEGGRCELHCSFLENKKEIFSLRYVVDTFDRARRMKENFHDKPETIYRGVMGLMAGNVNYLFDK